MGPFRVAPCVYGPRRTTRLRPFDAGRNLVGFWWATCKGLAHLFDKEPLPLVVEEVGLVSGLGLFTATETASFSSA